MPKILYSDTKEHLYAHIRDCFEPTIIYSDVLDFDIGRACYHPVVVAKRKYERIETEWFLYLFKEEEFNLKDIFSTFRKGENSIIEVKNFIEKSVERLESSYKLIMNDYKIV